MMVSSVHHCHITCKYRWVIKNECIRFVVQSESIYVLKTKVLYKLANIRLYICFLKWFKSLKSEANTFCLQTTSLWLHDCSCCLTCQPAQFHCWRSYVASPYHIKLHCNKRTKAYGCSLSQFILTCTVTVTCNNCNAVPDSGFQSNFSNMTRERQCCFNLLWVICRTAAGVMWNAICGMTVIG